MSKDVQCTVAFRDGTYGWSESYFTQLGDTDKLAAAEPKINKLLDARMPLSGGAVIVDFVRISDVRVRRDADELVINGIVISNGDGNDKVDAPGTFTRTWKSVDAQRAINPVLAVLLRLQGDDPVYHGQHMLSGMPHAMFLDDSTLDASNQWKNQLTSFSKALKDGNWTFPSKSRITPNDDRKVTAIDPATGAVTVNSTGWVIGDRVRLINMTKPKTEPVRSFSEPLKTVAGGTVTFTIAPPITWSVGPKSIAHREETIYVPIASLVALRSTKRSRGRPLNSPRGRRPRR